MPPPCGALPAGSHVLGERAVAGVPVLCPRGARREVPYYLHAPDRGAEGAAILLLLHDDGRDALGMLEAFGPQAARLGFIAVAPRFASRRFPCFQRPQQPDLAAEASPAEAMDQVLQELAEFCGADPSRIALFGFGAGAECVHRYALVRPSRVRSQVLAAASSFTFPDPRVAYPLGIKSWPGAERPDIEGFLRVPTLVLVEAQDEQGAPGPVASRRQGGNRIARAWRWCDALRREAERRGIMPRVHCAQMPGCGQAFVDCVRRGRLVSRALEFLIEASRRPLPPGAGHGSSVLFCAGPDRG